MMALCEAKLRPYIECGLNLAWIDSILINREVGAALITAPDENLGDFTQSSLGR